MALQIYKIASSTVGSGGASTIEFTNIPSGYTDLLLFTSARNNDNQAGVPFGGIYMQFNSSTTGYSSKFLYGYGSGSGSISPTGANSLSSYITSLTATTSVFSNNTFYIPNYTGNTNKSVSIDGVNENNATDGRQNMVAGLWSNTAAITSITLKTEDNNGNAKSFVQYTTATLYGIL